MLFRKKTLWDCINVVWIYVQENVLLVSSWPLGRWINRRKRTRHQLSNWFSLLMSSLVTIFPTRKRNPSVIVLRNGLNNCKIKGKRKIRRQILKICCLVVNIWNKPQGNRLLWKCPVSLSSTLRNFQVVTHLYKTLELVTLWLQADI